MASPSMASPVKESKAQKVERLKRAMNPWDGLAEIRRFAREGFASIPPEWIGTYFRWWGVYTQGDGLGVVGGKDGQGLALPFFMLRIRMPNGLLRSDQLRAIAGSPTAMRAASPISPCAKTSNCTGSRLKRSGKCSKSSGVSD